MVRLVGLDEDCCVIGSGPVAAHDHIGVERIEFGTTADATGPVGGDESRTGTEERVEDDVIAFSSVKEGVVFEQAVGLTVGWSLRPRRASEPTAEAPG